ncbi:MAG: response regulator [bacterium]
MKKGQPVAKILMVDDNDDLLLLVGARLRSNGYEVVTASNGETAIKLALREKPALILLDMGLPDLDGCAVCRRLKSEVSIREIPIIVMSANSRQVDKDQAAECGAEGYMAKPCDPGSLLEGIGSLLERRTPHVTANSNCG